MRPSHRKRNPMWPRRRDLGPVTVSRLADILKELYPQHKLSGGPVVERPWYAKLARERRWISWSQYFAIKPVDTGRVVKGWLNYESPFFGLLKRSA